MKNRKGFTLVELLAVIVIILVISVLAFTSISKKTSEMRLLSDKKIEELLKSSAKNYFYNSPRLKEEVKNKGQVTITYSLLKSKGYLSNILSKVQTYNDKDITKACVLINHSNNKYNFNVNSVCDNWEEVAGQTYYINPSTGQRVKGWYKIDDLWYYFDENTGAMKTGWLQSSGEWYYLEEDGKMATGVKIINNKRYYLYKPEPYSEDDIGKMAHGEYIDGYWYTEEGSWNNGALGQFKSDAVDKWYFEDTDGWKPCNESCWIDGKKYTFDSECYCTNCTN